MKKRNKIIFLTLTLSVVPFYCLLEMLTPIPLFGLRINNTSSVPYRFFLKTPFKNFARSHYVILRHSHSSLPLVKIIMGMSGDKITLEDQHVFVAGVDCGEIKEQSRSGFALTPIEETMIPHGFVYVYAPHEESFDSRYAEFGLIPIEELEEVLWPLF